MKNLILLHGAIGSSEQLIPLKEKLKDDFRVFIMDFSGHGNAPVQGQFSIERFADELKKFIIENKIQGCDIFGYSMGGFVALSLAAVDPETPGNIFTLGTKFHWSEEIAAREVKMLDPLKISEKIPAFASMLERRHSANDWKNVLHMTAEMMRNLGKSNPLTNEKLKSIRNKVRVSIGDSDEMVSLEETIDVFRNLPDASFQVFPGTKHPIEKVNTEMLSESIRRFFNQ